MQTFDGPSRLIIRRIGVVSGPERFGHARETHPRKPHPPPIRRPLDPVAADFKLVAECQRIGLAGLSDPMLGVTSDIQPLPHQLRAVDGELLEGRPLRFLLADDPGAGKTITGALHQGADPAGDVKRCLIMAPGGLVDQWQDDSYLKFGLAFEIRTRQFGETVFRASAFDQHQPLIAQMDQLSRNEELLAGLQKTEWDMVVPHRQSQARSLWAERRAQSYWSPPIPV